MKIDWFYLNSLAEANVTTMKGLFWNTNFKHSIGSWDLTNKDTTFMFNSTVVTELYKRDRKIYLDNLELEKEKNNQKLLEKEKNRLNYLLNQDIDLNTIEMEF